MSFIIVYPSYKPNEASTNRLKAFLKAFDEFGIFGKMVFVYPDKNSNRLEETYRNIEVTYLWDKYKCRNKIYKYIRSFFDAKRFSKMLHQGDRVFLIDASAYLSYFVEKKGLLVYQERTEHPDVNPLEFGFLQKKYLKACRHLSGMFTISTALKKVFQDLGVKQVVVVNMTVDIGRFIELEKQVQECRYIAYCGTASNNKDGVDRLIKAFSIVHKKYVDMKLYIIGKAPTKGDESGNLKLVDDLELNDAVVFTGIVPAKKMPQLLKNAELLALARPDSLQAQCGFPTKLGEYLLTENPVVVTKVGDIPLFLEDGVSALLVEPDDIEGFANKMIWALDYPDEAAIIGKEGSKVALKEFNYKTEAKKIVDVIFKEQS